MTRRNYRLCAAAAFLLATAPAFAGQGGGSGAAGADKVDVTLTGLSTFKGPLTLTCRKDSPDPVLTIEGKSANVYLRFHLHEPAKGTHKIIMQGLTAPAGPHVRFDVLQIEKQPYVIPAGEVTITDVAGRNGTIKASRFTTRGGKLEPIDLTLQATWACSRVVSLF